MQIPSSMKGQAAWWGPKDDRALLKGYWQQGGIPWSHKAITATVDAILSDDDLDFSVKVKSYLGLRSLCLQSGFADAL